VDFKAAAREVLLEVGQPLHYSDVTEIALESRYLSSARRTPQNMMRARLSVDVRDNPGTPFVQAAPGVCGSAVSRDPIGAGRMLYIECSEGQHPRNT